MKHMRTSEIGLHEIRRHEVCGKERDCLPSSTRQILDPITHFEAPSPQITVDKSELSPLCRHQWTPDQNHGLLQNLKVPPGKKTNYFIQQYNKQVESILVGSTKKQKKHT